MSGWHGDIEVGHVGTDLKHTLYLQLEAEHLEPVWFAKIKRITVMLFTVMAYAPTGSLIVKNA